MAAEVAGRMDAGVYEAEHYLPSESSLCEQFDVSRVTVRRALKQLSSAGKLVSEAGRGWKVIAKQSQMPPLSSRPIALIYEDSPESARIFGAACSELGRRGLYTVELRRLPKRVDRLPDAVSGAILFSGEELPERLVGDAKARGVPLVCIGHEIYENYDCVSADSYFGVRLMLEHFVKEGLETIGFLSARVLVENDAGFGRRQLAYESMAPLHGVEPSVLWLPLNVFGNAQDSQRAVEWVSVLREEAGGSRVGVICATAVLANGLLDAVCAAGVNVPEDLVISGFAPGFSDQALAKHNVSSYPAVVKPLDELGRVAAGLLMSRLDGNDSEPHLNLLRPLCVTYEQVQTWVGDTV